MDGDGRQRVHADLRDRGQLGEATLELHRRRWRAVELAIELLAHLEAQRVDHEERGPARLLHHRLDYVLEERALL